MNEAKIALEMANTQLEAGWIELDLDLDDQVESRLAYEKVEARLSMVSKLIKDAEKVLAKLGK